MTPTPIPTLTLIMIGVDVRVRLVWKQGLELVLELGVGMALHF